MISRQDLPHAGVWHTSSYSGKDNNCLEHSLLDDGRHAIRDAKDPSRRITVYVTGPAWQEFIDSQKRLPR
ncbi:DUF397 domain-containing protein [Streptomyces olivoreticuli]|uniref:DUF397 domain-containing protein n=1 Tax=Kitasatospora mediocidica TaxID=58352 RepID=A0A2S0X9Y9_9ACTN|nr:hypothetical protein [Kitasatospora mediocidica]